MGGRRETNEKRRRKIGKEVRRREMCSRKGRKGNHGKTQETHWKERGKCVGETKGKC